MKKTVFFVLVISLLSTFCLGMFSGCAKNESNQTVNSTTSIAPEASAAAATAEPQSNGEWTKVSAADLIEKTGLSFADIEDNKDVSDVEYYINKDNSTAEMRFCYNKMDFQARAKDSDKFVNLSDLPDDAPWDNATTCKIAGISGEIKEFEVGDGTTQIALWYDQTPGVMYSLSTHSSDLDGFDITAIAEMVYKPMQGDAE